MMPAPRRSIHPSNLAMKFAPFSLVTAVGLSCLCVPSCNPADPSAIQESQKALAETMAKNMRLNDEITALKNQVEQAKAEVEKAKSDRDTAVAKPATVEEAKMPSAAEVETKLDQEVAKLKDEARQKNPGSKVEGLSTWDVTNPGDNPYSCKAKVSLTDSKGSRQTLYWTGSANLKGEWKFKQAENLEAKQAEPLTAQPPPVQAPEPPKVAKKDEPKEVKKPAADDGFKPPTLTIAKDGDTRSLKDQTRQPKQPEQPTSAEKPKQKFDINLDKPVMGPGSK